MLKTLIGARCADERWKHNEGPAVIDLRHSGNESQATGVADHLPLPNGPSVSSTESSGGNLEEIRQAVGIVAKALERNFSRARPVAITASA